MRGAARRGRASSAVAIGSTVDGRYLIQEKLGEGGMAEVFRAEDQENGRQVAVKVLLPSIATNPEAVERTKREGQVLSDLHNPAIVNVERHGELEDGTVFLVMELLEGETLGERMRRGPLEPTELAAIVAGTCAGLHAAHTRGVIHRDLKPDNIFLCPTEHGLQVKLLDFGISKVYGEQKLTQTGEVLGTPRYMSPEQLGAEPDVDVRVDVYALGVILYEALAGKPPFLASTPTDLIIAILNGKAVPLRSARPDIPEAVEAVVMRAMSKVRGARYETAMALAEAYVDAVGGAAAVRGHQRRGMATVAMGGMKTAGAPAIEPPDPVAGKLKIGTFSGLADGGQPKRPVEPPSKGTQQMGASPGGQVPQPPPSRLIPETASPDDPEPSELNPSSKPMPSTRATPLGMSDAALPATAPPRQVPATSMMEASTAPSIAGAPGSSLPGASAQSLPGAPMSSPSMPHPPPAAPRRSSGLGRVLLVLGALLAGAASAGGVIFVMRSMEVSDDAPAITPTTQPDDVDPEVDSSDGEPGDEEAPPGVDPPAVEEGEPTEGDAPEEVTPTPVERTETEQPEARRRRRRSQRQADETQQEAQPDPPDDGPPTLPGFGGTGGGGGQGDAPENPLSAAQAAQRAGDPRRCVQILDDAIRSGSAPAGIALRRRADCHEEAGNRTAAIRDYQRFCRIFSDNPAIGEVRALLEGWGRSCP